MLYQMMALLPYLKEMKAQFILAEFADLFEDFKLSFHFNS